jgi:hypothetical protein
MAMIPQKPLFCWEEIENLGDLERLALVVKHLPDEALMRRLEKERGKGRDDYPVRAVWNSLLAGVVYEHPSIESLRRELQRNAQLRQLCGFDVVRTEEEAPPAWVYTRFLKNLFRHADLIDAIFDRLVEELAGELPDFGKVLAADGKAIRTHARPAGKEWAKRPSDGRRDTEADFGHKTYQRKHEDGSTYQEVVRWFGYKLHLLVDATYELPVAYEVTRASASELTETKKHVASLGGEHPEVLARCEALTADRGFDDGGWIAELWDKHAIKPVIDIRDMWKDGEQTKLIEGTRNVVYDCRGTVYCHCPKTGERRPMAYGGFEKERGTLKYRCPAAHYGVSCAGREGCPVGGSVRIALQEDRRVFTPLARSSYAWKRLYKKRTAAERVNGRLDVSFGFERHFIRGLRKMKLRMGLALVVMLTMALGRVREKRKDRMRSLVRAA